MALPKIKHPLYEALLPSTNKKVSYRPMLVREEKLLLMARESKENVDTIGAVKQVVRNCVVNEDVDTDKLATFDIDYMFLKIRAASLGAKVSIVHTDEAKETQTLTVNLDDVVVEFPPAEGIEKDHVLKISETLAMKLRYPRAEIYGDPLYMEGEQRVDRLMAHCIDKIYEGDKVYDVQEEPFEDIVEFLDSLDIESINKFRVFLASVPHLSYTLEFKDSIEKDHKIKLRSIFDFFDL